MLGLILSSREEVAGIKQMIESHLGEGARSLSQTQISGLPDDLGIIYS